ncbi:phosphate transport system permease protein [Planotetraspora thailandica]|uniref:Phosphate transport system permease protein n=1 Tax=Planotetraspora thailandica TaxID=487172 RepID=A0A8J3V4Y4_9ACTN|nr:phosphate ABC transporter permease subunit PstC [Planotetraspora thailandica]GII56951.1 phosphate transport system permease protein [Planotetraspora thailandica]
MTTTLRSAQGGLSGPSRVEKRRRLVSARDLPDMLFRGYAWSTGIIVVAIMIAVGVFLALRAGQALQVAGWSFFTEQVWEPDAGRFGIVAVLFGTLLIALIAGVVSVPLAVGTALFISEVASGRFQRTLISLVDLMAAVPSVVFGLWGVFFLTAEVIPVSRWLATWFGWFPLFRVDGFDPTDPLAGANLFTSSPLIAGLVVAFMVVPIQTSVMREAFSQAPAGEREGAYALGATRWGMITAVVLPFGKGGMIGGTMLGLGRALGETIAVYMIISPVFEVQWQPLHTNGNSVSALIANRYGEASPIGLSALMAAGLALFLITLVVNFTASTIVSRSRSGAESEV